MAKTKKSTSAKAPAKSSPKASKASAKAKAPKKPAKLAAKTPAKPAKSKEKSSGAEGVKKAAKKIVGAVAKVFAKTTEPVSDAASRKPTPAKPAKAAKAGKKAKKGRDDFEDDLLAGDEVVGSEDIPDLEDFNEEELEEEVEVDATEEDLDSIEADGSIAAEVRATSDDEVILTDAEGRRYCRVRDCDQAAVVDSYCRYHYLQLWKKIQVRRKILVDGKLERYVEELTSRYPDKFLEVIKKDLRSEKDFLAAIAELEIDESASEDSDLEEETQSFIDEVRGMATSEPSMSDDDDY